MGRPGSPPLAGSLGHLRRAVSGRPEDVHQDVQQASRLRFVLGWAGDGEDADQAGCDIFGGDVGAEVARRAAGVGA